MIVEIEPPQTDNNIKSFHLQIRVPDTWRRVIDYLIQIGLFYNRSEAIRHMIYDYISNLDQEFIRLMGELSNTD